MTTYAPIAFLNDNGKGLADVQSALATATELQNDFVNTGNEMLVISNGSASAVTATLKSIPDPYGRGGTGDDQNDETLSIPAGAVGFFPPANINGFDGKFTLSAFATIKVGVVRVLKLR